MLPAQVRKAFKHQDMMQKAAEKTTPRRPVENQFNQLGMIPESEFANHFTVATVAQSLVRAVVNVLTDEAS